MDRKDAIARLEKLKEALNKEKEMPSGVMAHLKVLLPVMINELRVEDSKYDKSYVHSNPHDKALDDLRKEIALLKAGFDAHHKDVVQRLAPASLRNSASELSDRIDRIYAIAGKVPEHWEDDAQDPWLIACVKNWEKKDPMEERPDDPMHKRWARMRLRKVMRSCGYDIYGGSSYPYVRAMNYAWEEGYLYAMEQMASDGVQACERFADNGALSHWELISLRTGDVVWSGGEEENDEPEENEV